MRSPGRRVTGRKIFPLGGALVPRKKAGRSKAWPPGDRRPISTPSLLSLRINTNVLSLGVQKNLRSVSSRLDGHMRRLGSGKRIATAADDAAGLGMSERMKARARSMAVAERNVQDGISLLSTAEGAMTELHVLAGRMRELVMASLNGTLSDNDRAILDTEYQALSAEADRLTRQTAFNGLDLLGGFNADIQAGPDPSDNYRINIRNMKAIGAVTGNYDLTDAADRTAALNLADQVIDFVSDQRAKVGIDQNRLLGIARSLQTARENTSASASRIADADLAVETAALIKDRILTQGATALLAQANVHPQSALLLLLAGSPPG